MSVKTLVQNNWKVALVGGLGLAAGLVAGPIASKAVNFLVPKALDHVSDTPITAIKEGTPVFSKESVKKEPVELTLRLSTRERAMLNDVAKDWGIVGRLSCTTVGR